jgi:4-diphosphocytidyl-2-C-methyl-D-erythritol kinase
VIRVASYAKINWSLRITGRRADGYHDLETIFQTISLHDLLTFREAARLSLTCDDPTIPWDDTNLVMRAARALGSPPVAIELRKRIPAGGGLGGGSSNAAATLVALSNMFEIERPLHDIALSLGSDVPFFLVGGTAYAIGRGEVLTPLPSRGGIALLLLLPEERVMTAEAFRMLRRFSAPAGVGGEMVNDFEEPVFESLPRLRELKERLYAAGAAWAGMSGSGSTIVGAFRSAATRDAAASAFRDVRAERAETT